jgi:hypothetical protein
MKDAKDAAATSGTDERIGEVRGGAWINGLNVTWPFARLEVYAEQLVLHCVLADTLVVDRADLVLLRTRRVVSKVWFSRRSGDQPTA